jgi:serine/threonine protein kinase
MQMQSHKLDVITPAEKSAVITSAEKCLEQGSYAGVKLGKYKGMPVAVKKFFRSDKTSVDDVKKEATFMLTHHSEYLTKAYFWNENPLAICMNYMSKGDLFGILKKETLSWDVLFQLIEHVVLGLHYMHSHGWIHFDIKTENILVDENYQARLTDFGFIEEANKKIVSPVHRGTVICMAPELFEEGIFENCLPADIYSLGIALTEMLDSSKYSTTFMFILGLTSGHQYRLRKTSPQTIVEKQKAFINEASSPEHLPKLILDCIDEKPEQRPTIQTVLARLHTIQIKYFTSRFEFLINQYKLELKNTPFSVSTLADTFSILPPEMKIQTIAYLKELNSNPERRKDIQNLAKKIYPYAESDEMKQDLFNLSHHSLAPIISTPAEEKAVSLAQKGTLFYRNFCTRHISWVTTLPTPLATLVEEYQHGPSLTM